MGQKSDHKQAWQTAQKALQAARNAEAKAEAAFAAGRDAQPTTLVGKIESIASNSLTAFVVALLAIATGISGAPNRLISLLCFGVAWLASLLPLRKLQPLYFAVSATATLLLVIVLAMLFRPEIAETDTHGRIAFANEPMSTESGCGATLQNSTEFGNGMLFTLGKPAMWFSKKAGGRRPLLTVGSCTLMYAEFIDDEFMFSADIYDSDRELVARIERNEFDLIPGKYAYRKRPDRSTLNVFDKRGKLLLSVRRPNRDMVSVTGDFICADGKEAKVGSDGQLTMSGPKGSLTWDKPTYCLINTGGFLVTEFGWGIGQTPCWACEPGHPSCPLICAAERDSEKAKPN
ncbi:hypothetical protein QWJ07_31250 [Frankia sp. RB7]|nr:hypothetical protein [Frankia sp. RB7]